MRFYICPKPNRELTEEQIQRLKDQIIERYHLREPFYIQYALWIKSLVQGSWGYSASLNEDVLPALLRRTPVTLELALYSLLLFVPLGIACGLVSGWKPKHRLRQSLSSSGLCQHLHAHLYLRHGAAGYLLCEFTLVLTRTDQHAIDL